MSQPGIQQSMRKNALTLALFTAIIVGMVGLVQQQTAAPIQAAQKNMQRAALAEIFPAELHDNNLLDLPISIDDPLLGNRTATPAYLATINGQPAGIILQATAPDGYSGSIELLIGIMADGRLSGVRVMAHKETPGLGDKIEAGKSSWINSFNGKSLASVPHSGWTVKKEDGDFDQFAGATITPRAVVKAVHRALQFFDANKDSLFALPGTAEVKHEHQL